jgi:hypothetical protein
MVLSGEVELLHDLRCAPERRDGSSWGAAIDRLVHRATILVFEGESVRTKEAKSRQTA